MEILASDVRQFQQLYLSKFGIELDDKTARCKLLKLVRQMNVIYRHITPRQFAMCDIKNEDLNEYATNEKEQAK